MLHQPMGDLLMLSKIGSGDYVQPAVANKRLICWRYIDIECIFRCAIFWAVFLVKLIEIQ